MKEVLGTFLLAVVATAITLGAFWYAAGGKDPASPRITIGGG